MGVVGVGEQEQGGLDSGGMGWEASWRQGF